MDNLIYSLNATMPVFLVILTGYLLRRAGWISEKFIDSANKINFRITLPALLLKDLMSTDIAGGFQLKFLAFCFAVTLISICTVWFCARKFLKDRSLVGEFVQASYRSSAAVLGAALATNIYGNTGMVPMMIIGAVPLYNIFAVVILTAECPESASDHEKNLKTTLKGIVTNPILISIVLGMILSLLNVDFPDIVDNTISSFANMATPLALLAIGGTFKVSKTMEMSKTVVLASVLKLVVWPAIFMPAAVLAGFRNEALLAIIIMLGSATTPSCYIMAKAMKSKGDLTSAVVVTTTFFAAFTLTILIFIAKSMGYL